VAHEVEEALDQPLALLGLRWEGRRLRGFGRLLGAKLWMMRVGVEGIGSVSQSILSLLRSWRVTVLKQLDQPLALLCLHPRLAFP
jgi:hypothetical protein